jgi:hypothetical protein
MHISLDIFMVSGRSRGIGYTCFNPPITINFIQLIPRNNIMMKIRFLHVLRIFRHEISWWVRIAGYIIRGGIFLRFHRVFGKICTIWASLFRILTLVVWIAFDKSGLLPEERDTEV